MISAVIYVCALCVANYLVFLFGPWWSLVNSFALIGLDFVLRDRLHERFGLWWVSALALAAGAISYLLNPAGGMIALASCLSFVLAALGDGVAYQALMRKPWPVKSNASNTVAAGIDSLLFPLIAFGALMPHIVLGQFVAKVGGGFIWSLVIGRSREVSA